MKKQKMNTLSQSVKNSIKPLVLFFLLSANCIPAFVQAQGNTLTSTPPATVKYIGTVEDQVFFQLEVDNKNGENFYVVIRDEEGATLYTGKFNDKKLSKKFQFSKSEAPNVKLSFELSTLKDKQTQVFQVATNTRVVEDVVVTRL